MWSNQANEKYRHSNQTWASGFFHHSCDINSPQLCCRAGLALDKLLCLFVFVFFFFFLWHTEGALSQSICGLSWASHLACRLPIFTCEVAHGGPPTPAPLGCLWGCGCRGQHLPDVIHGAGDDLFFYPGYWRGCRSRI